MRRPTTITHVGNIAIGGDNPIRIQSMATIDTNNTEGCVAQAKRIIDAGGELVRFDSAHLTGSYEAMENGDVEVEGRLTVHAHARCANCRMHSGFEQTAVEQAFKSPMDVLKLAAWQFSG